MKERTKLSSRKRRALRYIIIAAITILVVNYGLNIGHLLPIQSVRLQEELHSVPGYTRVVKRMHVPEIHRSHLLYVTGNDKATAISGTHLSIIGWTDAFGNALDCTTGAPLYAGGMVMNRDETDAVWVYYGRVDEPAIKKVEISIRHQVWDENTGKDDWEEVFCLTAGETDFIEKDGYRYFMMKLPYDWPRAAGAAHSFALGYDAEGMLLVEQKLEEMNYCFFG